ncbi:MAG TPA: hypothetical protein DCZ88_16315 [Pseudanabaena sp.]|nr:hypothetical protein [Pseudanabaena sp.]
MTCERYLSTGQKVAKVGRKGFYKSAIADLVGWVKERNPTMRNDNLIVELLQSLSDEVRTRFY